MAKDAFNDQSFDYKSLQKSDLSLLSGFDELALIKLIALWPRVVEMASEAQEPHRIAFYLNDLASSFHSLWSKVREDESFRFVVTDDLELTQARLSLVCGLRTVISSGLKVLGVETVEELRG